MKWFRHMTCSYNDERLSAIVDTLGMEGYGFWWRILEVVAEKLDETGDCSCSFSAKKWGNFFGFSAKKFEKFVRIFQNFEIFEVKFSENHITVNIPKLLKYRDEYSRKKVKKSGQTPDKNPQVDTDTEEEYINIHPLPLTSEGDQVLCEDSSRHAESGSEPENEPENGTENEPRKPRDAGTNPRAAGTNPRASGTNPRSSGNKPRAGKNSAAELQAIAAEYTQCPELRQALEDFRIMRERLRKPLTTRALRLTCGDLDKFAGANDALKVAILDQSIKCGWQGVFPLPEDAKPKSDKWAGAI